MGLRRLLVTPPPAGKEPTARAVPFRRILHTPLSCVRGMVTRGAWSLEDPPGRLGKEGLPWPVKCIVALVLVSVKLDTCLQFFLPVEVEQNAGCCECGRSYL